jgi:predicted O-methyltransferase YrrM
MKTATKTGTTTAAFWTDIREIIRPEWDTEIETILREAEGRRALARYNTGSISKRTALLLRALSVWVGPRTIIEVGTFIGVSTLAMQAKRIYTCDVSNDCLRSRYGIECFPYWDSTHMFLKLLAIDVHAEMVFVDGLLSSRDPNYLMALSRPETVYVFDDYDFGPQREKPGPQKGVANVRLLQPQLPRHVLIEPGIPETTLAVLVPKDWL